MILTRVSVLAIMVLSLCGETASQERGFEVRSANVLDVRTVGTRQIQALLGNVSMVQPSAAGSVKLWCDSAFRDLQTNIVQLFGNVRIVRDSLTLTSVEGMYYGDERKAEMSKGVRLVRGRITLTADYGEYWAREQRAFFRGNVRVVDSVSQTTSGALSYFENDEKSIAVGNVRVDSRENNLTVFGDSLIQFDREKYTLVPKNPRLMQIDTLASGDIDTLIVAGATMEAFRDSVQRFVAHGQVQMARSDFAARCGEATYFHQRDRIILRHEPVVWHAENQVSGDSVVIHTRQRKLSMVHVIGRSMAVSRADSTLPSRFDQLSSREITLRFKDGKVSQIDAERNATSLYYLFDGVQPNGVNRSSGDRIMLEFLNGKIDQIRIVGGVEGKYFPENMIANREREYDLDGFRWIADRPTRRQLFIINESHD